LKNRRSIRTNFITAIVLATVVLICALAVVMSNFFHSIADAILLETIPPLTKTAAGSVGVSMGRLADRILAIRDDQVFGDPHAPAAEKQRVLDRAASELYFDWLGLFSPMGSLVTGTPRSAPFIQSDMFAELREARGMVVDVKSDPLGEPEVVIGIPVTRDGVVVHYLVGSYHYGVLDYIINSFSISPDSIAYIVNNRGRFMAHLDTSLVRLRETIFSNFYGENLGAALDGIIEMVSLGKPGTVSFGRGETRRILSFAPVEGTSWSLVVETSSNDFVGTIYRGLLLNVTLAFAFMVFLVVAANVFIVRMVTRPLRTITNQVHKLGEGTFKYYFPSSFFRQDNEITQLAEAFNSMSGSLEGVIRDMESIVRATGSGKLDARVSVSQFKGDFRKIAEGMNDSLDLICSYLHAIPEAVALFDEKREMLFRNDAMTEFLLVHGMMPDNPRLLELITGGGFDSGGDLDPGIAAIFSSAIPKPGSFSGDVSLFGIYGIDNFSIQIRRVGREAREGGSLCIVMVLNNVTILTNAKQDAEAASRTKSEFISRMSHEIRTPMNAIIGMTQIAKNTYEQERILDCLDKIESSSTHLLGIINDVLDIGKIEAGKLSLNIDDFYLSFALGNVMAMIAPKAQQKNIYVNLSMQNIVHGRLSTDKQRLSQILINLLSNAVKFSPENSEVKLNVRETEWDDGTGTYRFEIVDFGIGISEEQAARLFRPFEQADGSITRNYGGTGLGLVICKTLVEMMGGTIGLQSKPGKGSIFTFTIRCESQDIAEQQSPTLPDAPAGEEPDFSGRRCLIVDDIAINREIIMEFLSLTSLEMETADNGLEAFEKFTASEEGHFDIILMDMQMPVMDGCLATQKIRRLKRRDARGIPIVAMTANVMQEDIQRAMEAGMTAHIGKPIEMDVVFRVLSEQLPGAPAKPRSRGEPRFV